MPRLLFTKTGDAVWMSHLDLMRLFQRAFKRAGLNLIHTQGYNPRPSVSIAMPLSVGVASMCELLDFELEGERVACNEITERLNGVLIPGLRVLRCYENGQKLKELVSLESEITLEYDSGVSEETVNKIADLFSRTELLVEKKGKNGPTQQDIIPMIRNLSVFRCSEQEIQIRVHAFCQNPSLNPMQIVAAIGHYLPECKPDHAICRRVELYNTKDNVFR